MWQMHFRGKVVRVAYVQVRLYPDGSYDYVSGPEVHKLQGRKQKVFAIRRGCNDPASLERIRGSRTPESHPGCAYGGFSWANTREEAYANLHDAPWRDASVANNLKETGS